jgi:hypothetical protein
MIGERRRLACVCPSTLTPQPRVRIRFAAEPGIDRIRQDVDHLGFEIVTRANNPIKGFRLPQRSSTPDQLVHTMTRCSLDPLHDFRQRVRLAVVIDDGSEQQWTWFGITTKACICTVRMFSYKQCSKTNVRASPGIDTSPRVLKVTK